jgi:hypothetical protein
MDLQELAIQVSRRSVYSAPEVVAMVTAPILWSGNLPKLIFDVMQEETDRLDARVQALEGKARHAGA